MNKRVPLFSFTFLLFNVCGCPCTRAARLAHGKFSLPQDSHSLTEWLQFSGDTLLYYLLALGVYLLLCVYHPQKKVCLLFALLLVICAVLFLAGYFGLRLLKMNP
jgi:hypothetical protein